MPKKAKELSALEVSRLTATGFHAVGGVAGLHLQVTQTGARSWVLRAMVGGKRRDMGLGGYPDVTLAKAREKAREARDDITKGIDPIQARQEAKRSLEAARGAEIRFVKAAAAFIDAKSPEWRNPKHTAQWTATLTTYAYPTIGDMQVRDVALPHIINILEPIWQSKTETATRLRGRLEAILDWATVRGYRTGDNPARWKGHLDKLLASPKKLAKVKHHRAVDVADIGQFMTDLRQRDGVAARALEFAILTAARSGEVRGMQWEELDRATKTWTVPAARMKAGKEHRVPLSDKAMAIINTRPTIEGNDFVFASPRGNQLSDMSLTEVMRRMNIDAVPHGFRSTFRDWAAERTNYPREVAEMALAHTIENKVEAAYRRGDLFEKRRRMMEDWAAHCDHAEGQGKVIPINKSNTAA